MTPRFSFHRRSRCCWVAAFLLGADKPGPPRNRRPRKPADKAPAAPAEGILSRSSTAKGPFSGWGHHRLPRANVEKRESWSITERRRPDFATEKQYGRTLSWKWNWKNPQGGQVRTRGSTFPPSDLAAAPASAGPDQVSDQPQARRGRLDRRQAAMRRVKGHGQARRVEPLQSSPAKGGKATLEIQRQGSVGTSRASSPGRGGIWRSRWR